ncbi:MULTISPECIES: phosphatase PAP2 family protein [unclassified Achromobacter]|uniref:phosphatase PAP2 family protein n=1 Tax=unclassified Achromobacter TaxID=2626865 RepID=UPI000B5188B3|nr:MULTISPECIES: phosphatase PAP2 family protein [unclassified Achromobacter]OWT80246.1 hypothetical protein CEY05_02190 [Achromobacter sp. HZ34]OWT82129.1 hypothetical protein CEY04_02190 [Achromobacter sp. HZ28]
MYEASGLEAFNIAVFEFLRGSPGDAKILIGVARQLAEVPAIIAGAVLLWYLVSRRDYAMALGTAIAIGASKLIEAYVNAHAFHARPFAAGFGPALVYHAANNSMPSSHATFAWTLAVIFLWKREWRYAGIVALLGLVVAWARIFVGIHWPLDMVGSALSAAACGSLGYGVQRAVRPARQTSHRVGQPPK